MTSTPSEWLIEKLGVRAHEVTRLLVEAGLAAHERAAAAHEASGLKQTNPYGATYWLAFAEEACARLEGFPGVERDKPAGSAVPYPSVNGALLLTVRASRKSDVRRGAVYLYPSRFRQQTMLGTNPVETQGEFDLRFDALPDRDVVVRAGGQPSILVVVDADARQGVRDVLVGEGHQRDDGLIVFSHSEFVDLEELGLRSLSMSGPRPMSANFDTGEIPVVPVRLRSEVALEEDAGDDS